MKSSEAMIVAVMTAITGSLDSDRGGSREFNSGWTNNQGL